MRFQLLAVPIAVLGLLLVAECSAQGILSSSDTIIGIDLDPPSSNSSYPGGEAPSFAVDGTVAKYLNFGGPGSGVIVTPNIPAGSIAKGLQLTTANDAEGRDPTTYELFGTNETIASADNSDGLGENWTLISAGGLDLPADRDTVDDEIVMFPNTTEYTSYKLVFPTNKGDGLFQIGEIELFGDVPDFSVFDAELFNAEDPALAIQIGPDSRFPGGENPGNLLDGDVGTKYLNFGKQNAGFIVTPDSGSSVVKSARITTANDFPERDPASYELYGTNQAIVSTENGQGDGETWTLIDSGPLTQPTARFANGFVQFDNDTTYTSYRMVFPDLKDNSGAFPADSLQISEIQFFSITIPEPTSLVLGAFSLIAISATGRRRG